MAETASRLKRWAHDEMGYTGEWVDSEIEDMCQGPLQEVWEWVITHCKRREEVEKIKGNLKLAQKSSDLSNASLMSVSRNASVVEESTEELISERGRLLGDLHAVLSKIDRLKKQMEQHSNERKKLDKAKVASLKSLKEAQQRTALLGLYFRQVNLFLEKLSKIAQKLDEDSKELEVRKEKKNNEKVILSGGGVEPESSTKMKEAVKLGTVQLIRSLEGGKVGGRGETRSGIIHLTKDIPGELVVDRLVEQSEERSLEVKNFDENERNNHDSLADDSLLSSVHDEVKEFSDRYIESLSKANQSASNCVKLREEIMNNMKEDTQNIDEVVNCVTLLHLRKSIDALKAELSNVEDLKKNPIVVESNLIKELKDNLCEKISFLIHASPLDNLSVKMEEISKIYEGILPLSGELKKSVLSLSSVPTAQLASLRLAPTSALTSVLVKGSNCTTLSPVRQLEIYKDVGVKSVPEEISHAKVLGLIEEVDALKRNSPDSDDSKQLASRVENIGRSLEESNSRQAESLLPLLSTGESLVGEVRDGLVRLSRAHSEWEEQGAAKVAEEMQEEWGHREGHSLHQTANLVRVAIAKSRQNKF